MTNHIADLRPIEPGWQVHIMWALSAGDDYETSPVETLPVEGWAVVEFDVEDPDEQYVRRRVVEPAWWDREVLRSPSTYADTLRGNGALKITRPGEALDEPLLAKVARAEAQR